MTTSKQEQQASATSGHVESCSTSSLGNVTQKLSRMDISVFPRNTAPPALSTTLPPPGSRFENIAQLAYCGNLLRKCLSPSLVSASSFGESLDSTQRALIDPYAQNEDEVNRIRWLIQRAVEEFAADSLKTAAILSEVLLLASSLDQEYYRKLLNCMIAKFETTVLLDIDLLQGVVYLVESTSSDYLNPDDLVRILAVLRARLQGTHLQASKHPYYLTCALSRLLDVMAEGKVQDLRRVVDQEPLSALFSQLKDSTDPYLKHQVTYAFQALMHVPNDETRRQFVLRHAGNITMGLLGVASVCKLDLGQVKDGVDQLYKVAGHAHEVTTKVVGGAQSLLESGQGIWASVKGGIFSGGRQLWYSALREAEEHIRNGRLRDFNRIAFEAPCREHIEFQWGICRLLGEIAVDTLWEDVTRKHAVDILTELYRNDSNWTSNADIGEWILDILRQIEAAADTTVSDHAQSMIQSLEKIADSSKLELYLNSMEAPLSPHPIKAHLSIPISSTLLSRVLAIPDVEYDIHRLRQKRIDGHHKGVYIPPQAKPNLQATDNTLFPLMQKAQEFLSDQRQVLLILGDSGAGKSTFNLELEHTLWKDYTKCGPIPLFINLPTIDNPTQDLIQKQLFKHNFSDAQIQEMKLHRQFIIICDGYDECQLKVNLHTTNEFNQTGQWKVKVVISCRSQYLGQDYRSRFQPQPLNRYDRSTSDLFQEAVVASFSKAQVEQYVNLYVKGLSAHESLQGKLSWTVSEYMDKLTRIPNLLDLVSNPFLLTLTLEALPTFVDSKTDLSTLKITRVQLYDSFVKQWLESNRARLERSALSNAERSELDLLIEDNFLFHGIHFQKDLATAIFIKHAGNPVVQYTHLRDRNTWKATFFSPDGQAKLLRESSTVTRSGSFFRFLHRSLLEYFFSRTVYDPLDYLSDDNAPDERSAISTAKTGLLSMSLTEESSILQFLAERVQADPAFKADLFSVIEDSKTDAGMALAAANAITILVTANVSFSNMNLRNIRIPGANLRDGQFDSTSFEGADLTAVNLEKAWLRKADLSNTQMSRVQFGELHYLKVVGSVWTSSFSADGRFFAVATMAMETTVFDTTSWNIAAHHPSGIALAFSPVGYDLAIGVETNESVVVRDALNGQCRFVLTGHKGAVINIVYSPDGTRIATSSSDTTARIWSSESGATVHILRGHSKRVWGAAFAPTGVQLATCSEDGTIRIWDTQTGESLSVLKEYISGPITCVAYSPDGYQIASGGNEAVLQLWNAHTGKLTHFLTSHAGPILGVSYSLDGRQIATCGADMTVRLADPHSGEYYDILYGHLFPNIRAATYSPVGGFIASGDDGGYIRLWKTGASLTAATPTLHEVRFISFSVDGSWTVQGYRNNTLLLQETLTGFSRVVSIRDKTPYHNAFVSSCGLKVATNYPDFSLRLWRAETGTGELLHVFRGHTKRVHSMMFSQDGRRLISSSFDLTVRVWDTATGEAGFVLRGHNMSSRLFIFSPTGDQIASSETHTVQVWSAKTGERLFELDNSNSIGGFDYSSDGKYIIVAAPSGHSCWDSQTGERVNRFAAIDTEFITCTFSSNGNFLTTAGRDGLLRVWDVSSEAEGGCKEVYQTKIELTLRMYWKEWKGDMYLVTLNSSLSRVVWKIVIASDPQNSSKEGVVVGLKLASTRDGPGVLFLEGAKMDNVEGLDIPNLRLMKQRGASGSSGSGENRHEVVG